MQVRRLRHRRVPVYGEHHDSIVGMLHAEEIMQLVLDGADLTRLQLADLLHEVVIVPPTKKVDELFNFFLERKTHAAIVLNEFGGIDGMVTLRGAIRFIFGNAFNGEPRSRGFRELEDGSVPADGALPLDDFNELSGLELPLDRGTTVGGLLLSHLDRLPEVKFFCPGIAVMLVVLAVNLLGDRLRDRLDSRLALTTGRKNW